MGTRKRVRSNTSIRLRDPFLSAEKITRRPKCFAKLEFRCTCHNAILEHDAKTMQVTGWLTAHMRGLLCAFHGRV